MITWSDCTIDWADHKTIARVIHVPSGTVLEGPFDDDDGRNRHGLLNKLDAAVKANS